MQSMKWLKKDLLRYVENVLWDGRSIRQKALKVHTRIILRIWRKTSESILMVLDNVWVIVDIFIITLCKSSHFSSNIIWEDQQTGSFIPEVKNWNFISNIHVQFVWKIKDGDFLPSISPEKHRRLSSVWSDNVCIMVLKPMGTLYLMIKSGVSVIHPEMW